MGKPLVIVAPAQTSFKKGLGQSWISRSRAASEIFQRADSILGERELGMLPSVYVETHFMTDERCIASMQRTDIPQIAIYIVSIACWAGLVDLGIVNSDDVVAAVGLSFGEIVLLTISGAFSFEDGLRFVVRRARAMQDTVDQFPGGLIGLATTDEDLIHRIIQHCKRSSVLSILRVKNTTTLLTGSLDALDRVRKSACQFGCSSFDVIDCAPFHSKLMEPAAFRVNDALDQISISQPAFPVVSNVIAKPFQAASIRKLLIDNLTNRILWRESLEYVINIPAAKSARWIVLEPAEVIANDVARFCPSLQIAKFDQPPSCR